jgi:hypothetical protein
MMRIALASGKFLQAAFVAMLVASLFDPFAVTASTININAFAPPGGPIPTTGCPNGSCPTDGYASPIYSVQPGDIVNFGTVTLNPTLTSFTVGGPSGGLFDLVLGGQDIVNFTGNPIISVDISSDVLVQCNVATVGCTEAAAAAAQTLQTLALIFTIPAGDTSIQVAWSGPFTYAAPTPLPAALPLFAGGIGFLSLIYRSRRRRGADHWVARLIPN